MTETRPALVGICRYVLSHCHAMDFSTDNLSSLWMAQAFFAAIDLRLHVAWQKLLQK